MKELRWMVSSKKDLMAFPQVVRREIGYALYEAQAISKRFFAQFGSQLDYLLDN